QFSPSIASDRTAGYVVFPKVVVDTAGAINGRSVDTIIQLTSTAEVQRNVHCFYVDASRHCSNATSLCSNSPSTICGNNQDCPPGGTCPLPVCRSNSDCSGSGTCVDAWNETDFDVVLTKDQPVGWSAALGFPHNGICKGGGNPGDPCDTANDC